jgi:hypothetical protein
VHESREIPREIMRKDKTGFAIIFEL